MDPASAHLTPFPVPERPLKQNPARRRSEDQFPRRISDILVRLMDPASVHLDGLLIAVDSASVNYILRQTNVYY